MTYEEFMELVKANPANQETFEEKLEKNKQTFIEKIAIRRNEFNDLWDRVLPTIETNMRDGR